MVLNKILLVNSRRKVCLANAENVNGFMPVMVNVLDSVLCELQMVRQASTISVLVIVSISSTLRPRWITCEKNSLLAVLRQV